MLNKNHRGAGLPGTFTQLINPRKHLLGLCRWGIKQALLHIND
jgi:hypothetical protein